MAMTVEQLHREAMALPPAEREELAMRLLHEADWDPEIEKTWIEECQRRMEDSRTNPRPHRDGLKVIDEIFERVRARAKA